jgi:NADPH2:quinone reductase
MTLAIRLQSPGGPEALRFEAVEVPAPAEGQALVRHTAIGVNYIDVYHRTGLYPLPAYPTVIGMEGAGVVEAVGPGVTDIEPGDRVAYAAPPPGAYAERRVMPAAQLVRVPEGISDRVAAAIMLKGMTAQYLLKETAPVRAGDTVLVHAAAGGVGLLLCQWAKHLGCTVIGTVGSDDKADLARAHGCDHPVVYTREDFAQAVKDITGGAGARVIYDSVGRDTFLRSLDSLAMTGRLVSFGQSSGPLEPIDLKILSPKSASISRPVLFHYTAKRPDLLRIAGDLFDVVLKGVVRVQAPTEYALRDAARAHQDLEARRTTGSLVLIP